jgi:TrmH family RNA methyltransferase
MQEITSQSNSVVKRLRKLATQRKAREAENVFIIEGWRSLKGLLSHTSNTYEIEFIACSDAFVPPEPYPEKIKRIQMTASIFESLSDVEQSPGILTVVKRTETPPNWSSYSRMLLLDRIRDPGNLGTLIRSAVGAGFDAILLYGSCVDETNLKTLRASMGTFPFIPIHTLSSDELPTLLDSHSIQLLGLVCNGGKSLDQITIHTPYILAIGSEANGLDSELLDQCHQSATIAIQPECESLNAAIAGSIAMFALR